jgi:hypothetical protein
MKGVSVYPIAEGPFETRIWPIDIIVEKRV